MAYNEELALRIRQSLGEQTGIVERKMFGGLCFMAHGNMLGGVMGDEIIVRVGAERYEDSLHLPHARPDGLHRQTYARLRDCCFRGHRE